MDKKDLPYLLKDAWQRVGCKSVTKLHDDTWYYFMHIPKTGGTTFRYILYDYFSTSEVYPRPYDFFIRHKGRYLRWKEFLASGLFKPPKRILIGHYGLNPISCYESNPPKILTFLRNPEDRLISSVQYLRKRNRRYACLSIEQILDQFLDQESLFQALSLGYNCNKQNLNQVKERLESIDFIGITESFLESIRLCNSTFDWDLKVISPKNLGKYQGDELTDSQLNRIKESMNIENEIYNYATRLFKKRLSQIKV